jgi:hypothetical protein
MLAVGSLASEHRQFAMHVQLAHALHQLGRQGGIMNMTQPMFAYARQTKPSREVRRGVVMGRADKRNPCTGRRCKDWMSSATR